MRILPTAALACMLALPIGAVAHAQTIPNPTNPTPAFPVATDGSPLPYRGGVGGDLLTGRSAYAPVAGPFNAFVGTGLGVAGTAVGAGLGTAGGVMNGAAGAADVR